MPKRVNCTECRTPLHHQKRFQIIEVIGMLSGRRAKIIGQYCEDCWRMKNDKT